MTSRRITPQTKIDVDNGFSPALKEIGNRIFNLTFREMKTLADTITQNENVSVDGAVLIEALLDFADATKSQTPAGASDLSEARFAC